jgi:hypothetical protein
LAFGLETHSTVLAFKGQHALPTLQDVKAAQANTTSSLPLEDIQADILFVASICSKVENSKLTLVFFIIESA